MEYKLVRADEGRGEAEILFSVYGIVDRSGPPPDIVEYGAFKAYTGRKLDIPVLDSHATDSVNRIVAKCTKIREVHRSGLPAEVQAEHPQATGGAVGTVKFIMTSENAAEAFQRVRANAVKFSFGYNPVDYSYDALPDGRTIRRLKAVELFEISLVVFPANEATMVYPGSAKGLTETNYRYASKAQINATLSEISARLAEIELARADGGGAAADQAYPMQLKKAQGDLDDYQSADDVLMELHAERRFAQGFGEGSVFRGAIDRILAHQHWWSDQITKIQEIVAGADKSKRERLARCYNGCSELAGAGSYESHLEAFMRAIEGEHQSDLDLDKKRRRELLAELDESEEFIAPKERQRQVDELSARLARRHLLTPEVRRRLAAEVETRDAARLAESIAAQQELEQLRDRRAELLEQVKKGADSMAYRRALGMLNSGNYPLSADGLASFEKELKRKGMIGGIVDRVKATIGV